MIYLVFDEVQAVENWEREVKSLYDRKHCKIILSGSSSYLLDSQVSTLLSGGTSPYPSSRWILLNILISTQ